MAVTVRKYTRPDKKKQEPSTPKTTHKKRSKDDTWLPPGTKQSKMQEKNQWPEPTKSKDPVQVPNVFDNSPASGLKRMGRDADNDKKAKAVRWANKGIGAAMPSAAAERKLNAAIEKERKDAQPRGLGGFAKATSEANKAPKKETTHASKGLGGMAAEQKEKDAAKAKTKTSYTKIPAKYGKPKAKPR